MIQIVNKQERFSPHTFAIFRQVWTLEQHERERLDTCFLRRALGSAIAQAINRNHEYKDFLCYARRSYEVTYIDCGIESLKNNGFTREYLLSFRYSRRNGFAVVLIREAYTDASKSYIQKLF